MSQDATQKLAILTLAGTLFSLAITAATPAFAGYEAQAAAVKDFDLKAVEVYKANGLEKAKEIFLAPDKKWKLGKDNFYLHVSVTKNDQKQQLVYIDTGFPELIGLDYNDVADLDGASLGKTVFDHITKEPNGTSIQLRFTDPETKAVSHTEGYCQVVPGNNVLCAWSQAPIQ